MSSETKICKKCGIEREISDFGARKKFRIENLELWSRHQPIGTRISDLIIFAKRIIDKYGDDESKY